MKFLCDNCKAKYQIADEKVAGKTVRMKCRKCGHQIEVRSAVTEGTGSIPPPAPLPGVRPPPRAMGGGLATSLSAQKPKAPVMSVAPNSALAGAFTKNLNDAPASSLTGSQTGGGATELSVTDEWYVAINGVPVGPIRISELRRKAATGAVNEESLCWQEGLEEWRPVRTIPELAQIVREAALGNRPSLADAASPNRISTFPSAPKTPVAPATRPSTIPPAPLHPSAPMPVSAPAATSPLPRLGPQTPAAPAARSNVVPFRGSSPSSPLAPSMDDMPLGPFGSSGAAAAFAPSPSPLAPQTSPLPLSSPIMPAAAPVTAPDPFANSGQMPAAAPAFSRPPGSMSPQPAANPLMSSSPSFGDPNMSRPSFHPPSPSFSAVPTGPIAAPIPVSVPVAEKKGGTPLWFWPILVLFLGFGGGAAYFVFARVQQPQPVVIQVPAPQPAPAPAPPPSDSVALEVPSPEPIAVNEATPKKGTPAKKTGPAPAGAPQPEQKGLDLNGLGGGGGPNIGPGPGGGGGGGGGLDQNGVERVVSAHRAGVKRTCWERGGADQKSSVNVTVKATVAPNGTVQSVSSSGDDPVVGKCIENQVKSWTFPAPGSATDINIPFKFVRQ
ncbi:MAG: GYF domain-containing protein [Labilithrix sp.]